MNTPNGHLRTVAGDYCAYAKLPSPIEGHYAVVREREQRDIAACYEQAKSHLAYAVRTAYDQLLWEINEQYDWLCQSGYSFDVWRREGQPYKNNSEMALDVAQNRHLYVFAGRGKHLIFKGGNVTFRAVHDIFGHATEGYQFGNRGEVNAWIHHSMMFSPLAQRALTTETLGQTSWVNFGPFSYRVPAERSYAEQKYFLLPKRYCDWKKYL